VSTTDAGLDEPLDRLLGPRTAKALAKGLSLATAGDLLHHYPRRYTERGELTDLATLQLDTEVTVLARIEQVDDRPMRGRKGSLLSITVTDGVGRLSLTFFNQSWRKRDLVVGRVGLFSGKVGAYRGTRQLTHPDYQLLADSFEVEAALLAPEPATEAVSELDLDTVAEFAGAMVPIYPATAALPTWKVARCVDVVLPRARLLPEVIPAAVREQRGLLTRAAALEQIHRPRTRDEADRAIATLRFEEALVLQTVLAQRRSALADRPATPRPSRDDGLLTAFDARMPFTLTAGQRQVGEILTTDLARAHPMHRLLQGEVGSGKTVVALRAMLQVVDAGGQAALLAPTEVLAQQHYRTITTMLGPLAERGMLGGDTAGTTVALVTGSQGTKARRAALLDAISGDAGIVIGTHALLEDTVQFRDLGLVVVDEQHRFGVEQRAALVDRGDATPHVLVMTATPIPRTIAMTVFGDLETSVLAELPAGRSPIATHVVPMDERPHYVDRAWERVREEVAGGGRAYIVCPRIGDEQEAAAAKNANNGTGADDDADVDDAARPTASVVDTLAALTAGPLNGLRIAPLHGRMKSDDKDATMRDFARGDLDVLVSTTVIEVGVDVAEATVMVILDADRFGVSQLHQLRGRVGRGERPGVCLLMTRAEADSPARERLEAVASTLDGFVLAEVDLRQRHEGDVLGADQSGRRSSLRLLSVLRHEDVIEQAREDAAQLIETDPVLESHEGLRLAVEDATRTGDVDFIEKG
jgi:ATP-dependent DNA helicase RecG